MHARSWPARLVFAVYLLCLLALAVKAALFLIGGDGGGAAIAGLCLVMAVVRPKGGFIAAPLAALLGAWEVAGLALATALAISISSLPGWIVPRRKPADAEALSACLAEAPDDLLYAARVLAAERPLSTWHLVTLAQRSDPKLWGSLLGSDPGEAGWDGPVLELGNGETTLFFAEAVGLGAEIARRRERRLDADLLALAACVTPLSVAEEWNEDLELTVERVFGASLFELVECQSAFAGTTAGRDLMRRVQVGHWAKRILADERELIYELDVMALPRLLRSAFS